MPRRPVHLNVFFSSGLSFSSVAGFPFFKTIFSPPDLTHLLVEGSLSPFCHSFPKPPFLRAAVGPPPRPSFILTA